MLKSIVVALDSTASSAAAERVAIGFAKRTGGALVGLGVLDVPWIEAPRSLPIGGARYQAQRNETLLTKGRARLRERVEAFQKDCAAAGVACAAIGLEGDPVEQIDSEADRHDLIVLGRDTNFHGDKAHDVGETVARLLQDTPRPLLIAPDVERPSGDPNVVVVAFDGSTTASRAMHMYVLLGLAAGREIHVVSIGEDAATARQCVNRGAALFRSHGITAETNPIVSGDDDATALLGAVSGANAGCLVMGARGRHGFLRRVLIGSTTRTVLRTSATPVFVHH